MALFGSLPLPKSKLQWQKAMELHFIKLRGNPYIKDKKTLKRKLESSYTVHYFSDYYFFFLPLSFSCVEPLVFVSDAGLRRDQSLGAHTQKSRGRVGTAKSAPVDLETSAVPFSYGWPPSSRTSKSQSLSHILECGLSHLGFSQTGLVLPLQPTSLAVTSLTSDAVVAWVWSCRW